MPSKCKTLGPSKTCRFKLALRKEQVQSSEEYLQTLYKTGLTLPRIAAAAGARGRQS